MSGSEPCHHASNLQPQPNPNSFPSRDSGQLQQPGKPEAEGFGGFWGICASPWEQQRFFKMVEGLQRRAGPLLIFREDLCQQTHLLSVLGNPWAAERSPQSLACLTPPSPLCLAPFQAQLALHRNPTYTPHHRLLSVPEPLLVAFAQHTTVFIHGLEESRAQFQYHLLCKASYRKDSSFP